MTFTQRALAILWPAFVMAGVLEMLVFVVADPASFTWFGADPLAWSASAVYTVTFLIFWGVIATSTAITHLLTGPLGRDGSLAAPAPDRLPGDREMP